MPISPHLQRKLQETLGADAADDLVTLLEGMDANRGDVGELRHEMQLFRREMQVGFARFDARFEAVDGKLAVADGKLAVIDAKFESKLEKALREQTRFFFLAWAVLLAAIIGLYARGT